MAIASGAREAEGAFLSVQGSRQSASLLEEREEVRWGARSEGVPGALMFLVTWVEEAQWLGLTTEETESGAVRDVDRDASICRVLGANGHWTFC